MRTFYSQAQCCVCAALQLSGDVEQPWLMRKYNSGSTESITTPPEEDRVTAKGNMYNKIGEDRTRSSEYTIADRQTHTGTLITTHRVTVT